MKKLKARLYSTEPQKAPLERLFGSRRFAWNHFLEARTLCYLGSKRKRKPQGLNYFRTCKPLTELKQKNTGANKFQALEYKCISTTRTRRFEQSSKTCSRCGWQDSAFALSDRTFE
jgi:transposase